ncbi:hypothetical protein ACFY8C_14550 [Streptomyces flavochromogenes]|uniref:Uncharacterized protein n=1 Tax=Streptomyces flavochromogenes TaxID=68199 RepID=A0ABW6XQ03_9ACTN
MADLTLTTYGVVIATLRGDQDGAHKLLDGLTLTETAQVAIGATLALADTLRGACDPQYIDHIIHTLQGFALTTTGGTQ